MLLRLSVKKFLKNLEWRVSTLSKTMKVLVDSPTPILIVTAVEASIISLVVLAYLIQVAGAWSSMRSGG